MSRLSWGRARWPQEWREWAKEEEEIALEWSRNAPTSSLLIINLLAVRPVSSYPVLLGKDSRQDLDWEVKQSDKI